MNKRISYVMLFGLFFLASCGGGSTVTAVSLSADPAQVNVGERSTITAKSEGSVTGDTLGEKVSFSLRVNESGAELSVINDRLDGNGEAKAIYRAGNREGVDIVEASFGSGARATVTITVGEGVVIGNIRLEAFSWTGTTGVHTGWRIRAIVTDNRGNPAPGVTVNFSTNNGTFACEGTVCGSTATTNNAGIAEALLDLSGTEGGARVWATVGGITVSVAVASR
ncbi:MAG TPA: hypothetical protein ENN39_11285 [Desulfonatronum sp.]|nr:hypothetical protein [Desulfonatronum sp.]